MIICSVSLAVVFLIVFIYNAKKGQFEDDESPAVRILLEEDNPNDNHSDEPASETKTEEKSN